MHYYSGMGVCLFHIFAEFYRNVCHKILRRFYLNDNIVLKLVYYPSEWGLLVKKNVAVMAFFVVTYLLIHLGFQSLENQVEEFNNTPVELELISGKSCEEGIDISTTVSKFWEEPTENMVRMNGAQYDGVIYNNGEYPFRDWQIVVYLPRSGVVDSLWNAEYVVEDERILLTAMDYNSVIEPGGNQTFGFVMKSPGVFMLDTYSVVGYFEKSIEDLGMYKIMRGFQVFWIFVLACYIVVEICLIQYRQRQKRDEKIILQTMDTFISFIDARDPYTYGHSGRVAEYARELATRMNLSKQEIQNCYYIALMHDCGKIGIPDSILNKPGKLTAEERKVMEDHTRMGAKVLERFNAIPGIQDGALHHHERYDGKGYPDKLKGEEISLVARIICVADAFDAMNSDRCYRKRLEPEKIMEELKMYSGKQFDSRIVSCMLDMINDGAIKEWA